MNQGLILSWVENILGPKGAGVGKIYKKYAVQVRKEGFFFIDIMIRKQFDDNPYSWLKS